MDGMPDEGQRQTGVDVKSRQRWNAQGVLVYHEVNGVVLLDTRFSGDVAPMVMGDIQPYQSMIDGSTIQSRSQHREHLRQHGCIEIGNETKALKAQVRPMAPPPGLKETIIRVANEKLRR